MTILRYCGTIREFRAWLKEQRTKVISLSEYRMKKERIKQKCL